MAFRWRLDEARKKCLETWLEVDIIISMPDDIERIPPDIKLLGEIVVALNISCRNAGIYPKNHSAVGTSLGRAFGLFQKMFEQRQGLTIAVGKDTLIIDNYPLERKNSSYSQFAGLLNKLNIAYVTFLSGFTKDELYIFQQFVSRQLGDESAADLQEVLDSQALTHIQIGFADYSSFSAKEGKTSEEIGQEDIWKTYITGLISGTLKMEELEALDEISSDVLSGIINKMHNDGLDKASSDKFFAVYIQKFFQRPLSNNDIKKLLDFLNGLQPDLREQFMGLMVDMLSNNITLAARSLNTVSPDMVLTLVEAIKSQKTVPDNLRSLFDKLLDLAQEDDDPLHLKGSSFVDDVFLPSDMLDILSKSELEKTAFDPFETSVSEEYQREIRKLLELTGAERISISLPALKRDCDDDYVDKMYYLIVFELMTSNIISEQEYRQFSTTLQEQTLQYLSTGQYGQILQIIKSLRMNLENNRFTEITSEALKTYFTEDFCLGFIDSLKVMGRQVREEAWKLCEFYGGVIIPYLLSALIVEESKAFRSLLMGFLKQFGETVVPYALKELADPRWFVKRNMLALLLGCKSKEIIPYVRPYCTDENEKVRWDAIKCLLSLQDADVIELLMQYMQSASREEREQAITLTGIFRVKEAMPDLIRLYRGEGAIKTDLAQKLLIIQSLGHIGDPRCLDMFRQILSAKSLFFRKDVEVLKEEVYKTLKNFPYKEIEGIVSEGVHSRNKLISDESLRLSKMRDK